MLKKLLSDAVLPVIVAKLDCDCSLRPRPPALPVCRPRTLLPTHRHLGDLVAVKPNCVCRAELLLTTQAVELIRFTPLLLLPSPSSQVAASTTPSSHSWKAISALIPRATRTSRITGA